MTTSNIAQQMKKNECSICGWKGRTHMHHIIPLCDYGKDIENNKIEICPNHHAEASEDEEAFAIKYKLKGEKRSKEELKDLERFSHLFYHKAFSGLSQEDEKEFKKLTEKFDKVDAIAYLMGITRKSVMRYMENTK